jgi:hypothetical protein
MKSLIILAIFVILITLLFFQSQGLNREYKKEAMKGIERTNDVQSQIISEKDIIDLPKLVQNYLKNSGVIGKEKVNNIRISLDGQFNMGKGWGKMKVNQYNFFDKEPARLSFMNMKVSGMTVYGLDSYLNEKGEMSGKIFGLFPVIKGQGEEMDQSEQAVILSEMCLLPGTLIDKRITWETIDSSRVRAIFNNNGKIVSGILAFNDEGQLIKFTTEDKLYQEKDNSYSKVPWSVLISEYKEMNGMKIGTFTEAVWHFPKRDFIYGKLRVKKLEINTTTFH